MPLGDLVFITFSKMFLGRVIALLCIALATAPQKQRIYISGKFWVNREKMVPEGELDPPQEGPLLDFESDEL